VKNRRAPPPGGVSDKAHKVAKPGAAVALTTYEGLPPSHKRFVDEYMVDLNGAQAARRSQLSTTTGYKLLHDPKVQAALKERRTLIDGERSIMGARYVLNKLWDIESADPAELSAIIKINCRFCHGVNGAYQFTRTEAHRRMQAHELGLNQKPLEALFPAGKAEAAAWEAGAAGLSLDPQGGDGFEPRRDPNPNCTECGGEGITLHHIADTRKLSPGAKALYRGAKVTAAGIEILVNDQETARDMLAKHYGVATERKRLIVRKLDPDELSDEELVQTLAELEAINNQITDAEFEDVPAEPAPEPEPVRKRITRPT
jgi:phage terminase small subunit